jgi:hypothetical protein
MILAVGPEVEIDKAGYRRGVRTAQSRLEARMESGEHTPSLDRLARVAAGLDSS